MPKAIWNGQVIAQSEDTKVVEGNHYFPPNSVERGFLKPSDTTTECPWKGTANYFHLEVGGDLNSDAAWFYETPKEAASEIKDHVAFWKGVEITS